MRVEAIKQASDNDRQRGTPGRATTDATEAPVESRALTVIASTSAPESRGIARQANFLAHLIATKDQAPQTRARRRAEPDVAIAAYRSTAALLRA